MRSVFRDIEDLEDVGLVWGVLVGSVDNSDLGTVAGETHLSGFTDDELDDVLGSLEGWDLETDAASDCVHLSDNRSVDRASKNLDLWSVL